MLGNIATNGKGLGDGQEIYNVKPGTKAENCF